MKKFIKITLFIALIFFCYFNINCKTYASISNTTIKYLPSFTYTGEAIKPTVKITHKTLGVLKEGTDYKIAYKNNINAGTGKIIITGIRKGLGGQITKTFTIKKKSIKSYESQVSNYQNTYIYTGNHIKPSIYINGLESSNYKIEYSNNLNVGKAKITITGKGNYKDTITMYFSIEAKDINSCKIDIPDLNFVYTGKKITPSINYIKSSSGNNLKIKTDYTVTYSNNKNAGTGIITIKGKGNYSGKYTKSFKIYPKEISINYKLTGKKYKNDGKIKKFPIKVYIEGTNTLLKENTDYTLKYSSYSSQRN